MGSRRVAGTGLENPKAGVEVYAITPTVVSTLGNLARRLGRFGPYLSHCQVAGCPSCYTSRARGAEAWEPSGFDPTRTDTANGGGTRGAASGDGGNEQEARRATGGEQQGARRGDEATPQEIRGFVAKIELPEREPRSEQRQRRRTDAAQERRPVVLR